VLVPLERLILLCAQFCAHPAVKSLPKPRPRKDARTGPKY